MKRIIATLALVIALAANAVAGLPITKVDKVEPTQEIFMDMAVTAASASKAKKGLPCGAVIILNNAWRSTGKAADGITAEQDAVAKARLSSLANAVVFTVNEPITEAYNDLCHFGAEAIYFVNPREKVIAAGIYPASAYDDSKIDSTVKAVPMTQMSFADAEALIK